MDKNVHRTPVPALCGARWRPGIVLAILAMLVDRSVRTNLLRVAPGGSGRSLDTPSAPRSEGNCRNRTDETFVHHLTGRRPGGIQCSEFHALLTALSGDIDDDECAVGLRILDADGNGTIEFDEFVTWWAGRL